MIRSRMQKAVEDKINKNPIWFPDVSGLANQPLTLYMWPAESKIMLSLKGRA